MNTPRIVSIIHCFCANASARLSQIRGAVPRFTCDRRANVAMIFAIVLVPITFAAGMGVDYTSAARRRDKLNAAADAAALAAVTPAMMSETKAQAQTAAQNVFTSLASVVSGIQPGSVNVNVTVTQTTSSKSITRTVLVTYTAQSENAFGGILGQNDLTIGGTSQSSASTAPNINFYVLADSSPSMAIPATTAGVNAMISATANAPSSGANAGGCAFACHEFPSVGR